jgi:hypothetical protein
MVKKPKFKPVITRVRLNPEQAVLACNCYNNGQVLAGSPVVTNQVAGMWGFSSDPCSFRANMKLTYYAGGMTQQTTENATS